ncbi:hypothetical protein EYC80_008162 [Monilinia laxa]|uniref:RecA family profile 1 domain-containing protein n=1 Tax=Monilinia laxa TaxID=61186 RepID=A0A5N6JTN5_MONLA|nr:hypothetical protein EYC80_008162 [Monilinia laxa]
MDYQTIHGLGRSNFSSSSPHRMPTVSAAQALQELESSLTRWISTGLKNLDLALQNEDSLQLSTSVDENYGGISRGRITEVYGPPGVGKTALGMHLAAKVLYQNEDVVWMHHIQYQVLDSVKSYKHFHLQNLPIIVKSSKDSFSTLIDSAFPRKLDSTPTPRKPGAPNPSSRKFPLLQYLINALQKLATTRNIAIIILNQCVTKMRPGLGAALIPSISVTAWEQGLGCRVALFRDWGWDDNEGNKVNGVRFAQVVKAEGVALSEGRGRFAAFVIGELGLSSATLPPPPTFASPNRGPPSFPKLQPTIALPPQKRKRAEFEIPDSDDEDDEDYGWAEEDEELPPMPPQWQGSEDILVPPPGELEAEEEVEEAEEEEEKEKEKEKVKEKVKEKEKEEDIVNGNEKGREANVDGENHREESPREKYSAGVYERDRELPDSEDELAL